MAYEKILIGAVGIAALINIGLISVKQPRVLGFMVGLLLLAGHSHYRLSESAGTAGRFVGLVLLALVPLLLRSMKNEGTPSAPPGGIAVAVLGVALFGIAFAQTPSVTVAGASGALLLSLVGVWTMARSGHGLRVVQGALVALAVFVLASLTLYALLPQEALTGTRAKGVFVNPNTLGYFSAILILMLFVMRLPRSTLFLLMPAAAALVLSGSRSAALAVGTSFLAYVLLLALRGNVRRTLGVLAGLVVVGALLWSRGVVDGSGLLRTENSRLNGNIYVFERTHWSWFSGVGFGRSAVEVASTPLRWLVEAGLVAGALVVLAFIFVLAFSLRRSAETFAVAIFGIISACFEGWFFSGGSGLFVFFWIAQCGAALGAADRIHRRGADAATDARVQRAGFPRGEDSGALPSRIEFDSRLG